jgi:hypothetical protein
VDSIELTIPRERDFGAVADLVLAGLASRADLTLETIDDLQLAIESLLEHGADDGALTVRLELAGDGIRASVGPFDAEAIEAHLGDGADGGGIGLRRVLETTVDRVELAERDGACWIELRKEVARA